MNATSCRSAGRTETGKVRRYNEDAILLRDDAGLWVVADGMGGHSAGDYASNLIVERLGALPRRGDLCDFLDAIDDALEEVNDELMRIAAGRGQDIIGSTVVVLVHDPEFMLCGWVGDSRGYCFDEQGLRQITEDHVHGARDDVTRFHAGPASQVDAPPGALTRAVGAQPRLFIDWAITGSRPGMKFVLCSDGLNKEVGDREIGIECGRRDSGARALLARLFDLAMGRSARDNVSAVTVQLLE